MNQRSCMRDFARYTILSVLGTLGVSCYILADTFFVSKGLGAKQQIMKIEEKSALLVINIQQEDYAE